MKFSLLFFLITSITVAAENVYIGKALKDCQCQMTVFDEAPTPYSIKKNALVGGLCFPHLEIKGMITCTNGSFTSVHCAKDCVQLIVQKELTKQDYIAAAKKVESAARAAYTKIIPQNIFQEFQKKYPSWLPVLVNMSDDNKFLTKYEINQDFYFQLPLTIDKKLTDVSIIYFYKGMEELLTNSSSWSFWDTTTGELLYENLAPYRAVESGYVNKPCLVPSGKDFKDIVLYGMMAGPGDAAGCCGPYSFKDLKKSGPTPVSQNIEILDNVTYRLCGQSTDRKTGKYDSALSLSLIDGPANIRSAASLNSKIIGSCHDRALVADLGSHGKWNHVYCDGLLGWTFGSNIRLKK